MTFYVDSREPAKVKDYAVNEYGATIETLTIGDFANDEKTVFIERKEVNDLMNARVSKRWDDQIRTLTTVHGIVIIEGKIPDDLDWRNKKGYKIKMLTSTIDSIDLKYRIPYRKTKHYKDTVDKAAKIFEKLSGKRDLSFLVKRKTNNPTLDLFAAIPGVGAKNAKILALKYGSMMRFCKILISEGRGSLTCINGIGDKKAETIYNAVHDTYEG